MNVQQLARRVGQEGSYIRTLCCAAIFFAIIYAISTAHWSDIFWGKDRSRLASAVELGLTGAVSMAFPLLAGPLRLPSPSAARWRALWFLLAIACLGMSCYVFAGYCFSGDEKAYLFEADTLKSFRLWNPPPPLGLAQTSTYIWVKDGKWVAQYSPGWPALLALFGGSFPTGRLANALCTVLAAYSIKILVDRRGGGESSASWLAVLLFGLSSFALLNGGSMFSHSMAAAFGALAMVLSGKAVDERWFRNALATGACIGVLCLTRNATALVFAMAVAVDQFRKPGWLARGSVIGLGIIPFVGVLLWYQKAITGDPFMPVYWYGGRTVDHLYFDFRSIKLGIKHAVTNQAELSLFVAPLFVLMWIPSLWICIKKKKWSAVDLVLPFGIILYLFYPLDPGARWGPRYYFDFWPMAVVTIGVALSELKGIRASVLRQMLTVSIVYTVVLSVTLPAQIRNVVLDRYDVFEQAQAKLLNDAVVCAGFRYDPGRSTLSPEAGRNGIDLTPSGASRNHPVVYVNCEKTTYAAIRKTYPQRKIWLYERNPGPASGYFVEATLQNWPYNRF